MLTKAIARTMIQQVMDDPSGAMWTSANLDQLTEISLDEMWGDLLTFSPWLLSQLDTIATLTSPGYLDLRTVANGGALSQRFHRLQSIVRGGTTYSKADTRDVVVELNSVVVAPDNTYVFLGDQLWLFPLDITADVEIRYSYKPAGFVSLGEGAKVTWPDGHDSAFIYEIAARALVRGDREDNGNILRLAGQSWARLIDMIRRRQIGPIVPWGPDTSTEWGS